MAVYIMNGQLSAQTRLYDPEGPQWVVGLRTLSSVERSIACLTQEPTLAEFVVWRVG
jgi:hypothetical protein